MFVIMLSQDFIINLGLTLLVTSLIFLYFRRRLSGLEFKINTLFTLIQEHNASQNNQQINMYPTEQYGGNTQNTQDNVSELSEENLTKHNNMMEDENQLIEVSEDESETESETESESESEDEHDANNTKSISINTNEPENDIINVDVEKLETLENQFTQPFDNLNNKDPENILELLEVDTKELLVNKQSESKSESESESETEPETESEPESETEIETQKKDKPTINQIDFSKLTVPKLKELVLENNLRTTVRKLKKGELIEILQTA